jgi:hypothetical protein
VADSQRRYLSGRQRQVLLLWLLWLLLSLPLLLRL